MRVKNYILKCFVATLLSPGKVWDPVNCRYWKWMFCWIIRFSPGKEWFWKLMFCCSIVNVLLLHCPSQEKYGIENWMFCCYIVHPRKSMGLKNECFVATLSIPRKVWDWKMNVLLLHCPAPENYESQYDHDTGMVTMLMRPEPVRAWVKFFVKSILIKKPSYI